MAEHKLTVELAVGHEYLLVLEGAGSAVSGWSYSVDGSQGVVDITRLPSGIQPPQAPDSFSLPERFRITARSPGKVTVVFILRRAWESDSIPPRGVERYEVVVAAAGC